MKGILSGAQALAIVLALILGSGIPAYAGKLELDIILDPTTLDIRPPGGPGPFVILGDIHQPGTIEAVADGEPVPEPIGIFRCWGWFRGPVLGNLVSQEYLLFEQGKIQIQGLEKPTEEGVVRAVVGGTGDFKNARGEAVFLNHPDFRFTATFDLRGARGDR